MRRVALFVAALALAGCAGGTLSTPGEVSSSITSGLAQGQVVVQTATADVGAVAQGILQSTQVACADAAPFLALAETARPNDAGTKSLVAYGSSICSPAGTVNTGASIDPGTAAWIAGIKTTLAMTTGLQLVGQQAPAVAATPAAPPSVAPVAPATVKP